MHELYRLNVGEGDTSREDQSGKPALVPIIVRATMAEPVPGSLEDVEISFDPAGLRVVSGLSGGPVAYPLGAPVVPWTRIESIAIADPPSDPGAPDHGHRFGRRRARFTRPSACVLRIGVRGRTPRAFHLARIGPEQLGGYLMPVFEWLEQPRLAA
jgi:hypothetical protein